MYIYISDIYIYIGYMIYIYIGYIRYIYIGFPGGTVLKDLPLTKKETQVQPLGQEYPLEKGIATHYSILA